MKVKNINIKIKDVFYKQEKLRDIDIKKIQFFETPKIKNIWYCYFYNGFEGIGNILALDDVGSFYIESLYHDEQHGPIDYLEFIRPFVDFNEIKENSSAEFWKEIKPLIIAAKKDLNIK